MLKDTKFILTSSQEGLRSKDKAAAEGKVFRKKGIIFKILRRKQQAKRKAEGICFIHGSGKRKTQLQKTFEQKKTGIKNDNLVTVWMFMPVYL